MESLLLVETVDEFITGIDDQLDREDNAIKIYPNPTKSMVNIEVKEQLVGEDLEIYTMNGKCMFSQIITNTRFVQDVSGYNAGHYFVRISGHTEAERLLKID